MAAKIQIVEGDRAYEPNRVARLWFFPEGSEYLRYSPYFHMVHDDGFRTNFPLSHGFVIVHEGKLSVKDFYGNTFRRIQVQNQVWFVRGTSMQMRARGPYAKLLQHELYVSRSPKPVYG